MVNLGAPERQEIPASLAVLLVLLFLQTHREVTLVEQLSKVDGQKNIDKKKQFNKITLMLI